MIQKLDKRALAMRIFGKDADDDENGEKKEEETAVDVVENL